MRRGPDDPSDDIRGPPQPPAASASNGDGLDNLLGGPDAAVGVDVEPGRHNELQLPRQDNAALLLKHGHNLSLSSFPHCYIGPNSVPKPSPHPNQAARLAVPSSAPFVCRPAPIDAPEFWPTDAIQQPVQILRPTNLEG